MQIEFKDGKISFDAYDVLPCGSLHNYFAT